MKKILITILGILIGFVSFGFCDVATLQGAGYGSAYSSTGLDFYIKNISSDTLSVSGLSFVIACSKFNGFVDSNLENITYTYSVGFDGDSWYCVYNTFFNPVSIESNSIFSGYVKFNIEGNNFMSLKSYSPFNYGSDFSITSFKNYSSYGVINRAFIKDIYYESQPANNILNILDDNGNSIKSIEVPVGGVVELFINSPVIQNSNNVYTYDGVTGINLFYNDSSFFYTKSKLYLNGSYGYNNNVFTPYCL